MGRTLGLTRLQRAYDIVADLAVTQALPAEGKSIKVRRNSHNFVWGPPLPEWVWRHPSIFWVLNEFKDGTQVAPTPPAMLCK